MKNLRIILIVLNCINISCEDNNKESFIFSNVETPRIDSLFAFIEENPSGSEIQNLINLTREEIKEISNDTIRLNKQLQLAYYLIRTNQYNEFPKLNLSSLELANNLKKNNLKALISEYLGFYYSKEFQNDSAFFYYNNARNSYAVENVYDEGKMLLNLAVIQEYEKDYIGSEINSIKALEILKKGDDISSIYLTYNNLGVVCVKLKKYDLAIEYYHKSMDYLSNSNQFIFYSAVSYNNIGQANKINSNYRRAIDFFNKGIDILELNKIRSSTYANLLDNKAYAYFKLGIFDQLPKLFFDALIIRDSLNIKDGQVESNLHLSEYYLSQNDKESALKFVKKAEAIAKEASYNDGLLKSYKLLASISDNIQSRDYLNKHIQLTDSLQQHEREIREKFTRIAYETDEVIKEKEVLTRKNWWISTLGTLIILFGGLIFFMFRQRAKNKELLLTTEQNESNIKIYNLMLNQQKIFQQGSDAERSRISKELHDGVLGKIFGARLSLEGLNESKNKKDIKEREKQIEKLQIVEEEVRSLSHNLSPLNFEYEAKFSKLIEDLLFEQSKIGNYKYELNFSEDISFESLSNEIKINIYRIIQEALINIAKHANSSEVIISFKGLNNSLLLDIFDNGVGFNINKKSTGIGIKNMKSRVKDVKGKFGLDSKIEKGTSITINIPI